MFLLLLLLLLCMYVCMYVCVYVCVSAATAIVLVVYRVRRSSAVVVGQLVRLSHRIRMSARPSV